jgi:tartrate-resistant acid phosphatase type 5
VNAIRTLITLAMALVLTGTARAEPVRFAMIGDYGVDDANELAVANLVRANFKPEFVITVGDNNYIGAANIDRAIGQYYHEFIGNYSGSYGAGASSNRFFPALGNHDWDSSGGYSMHLSYFTLPGNERYYDFVRGPVHVFILNSDSHESDGNTFNSSQAQWFSNRIAASTSPWRVVICQDPPYSSNGGRTWMRWPFEQWGASIVVSGDAHHYERIMLNNLPYVVNGAGGAPLIGFGTPIGGSVVQHYAPHGAMQVIASETNILYEFWSIADGGTLVDRFEQVRPALSITRTNNAVRLSWPNNGADGFVLQSTTALTKVPWTNVAQSPSINGDAKSITLTTSNQSVQFFRLRK